MKPLLCLSTCILFFSGCIKDPPIPNPQPNPDWLIKKITVIDASSEDGNLNYTYFVKSVQEFMYNQYNKPVSRRAYSNYSSSRDTNDIVLTGFDTLYYDNQHRVTQLDYFGSWANRIVTRKKFFYKGSDPMMYKYENYSAEPPRDTLGLISTAEFLYTDTAVLSIQMNLKGGIDTTHFVYKGGNYAYWYAPGIVDEHVGYYEYDNKPNVERCFNLPQPGLIFPLPQDYAQTMKPSRNNWVLANSTSNTSDFGSWRSITYNEHDLIHSTHTVDYSGPSETRVRYEYIRKN